MKIITHEYDIALSFAGEDRAYVEQVASCLKSQGVRVFYDLYEEIGLWGKDLYAHLIDVYKNRAKYTVVFLSSHYAQKLWCKHELRSAQARAFTEAGEYILPVRFDDTELPSILPTTGYLDLRKFQPNELADRIYSKLTAESSSLFDIVNVESIRSRCHRSDDGLWRNCHKMRFLVRQQRKTEVEILVADRTEPLDALEVALVETGPHYTAKLNPDWPLSIISTPFMDWLICEPAPRGLKCYIDGRLLQLYFPRLAEFKWLNDVFYAPPCWYMNGRTGSSDPANSRAVTFTLLHQAPEHQT